MSKKLKEDLDYGDYPERMDPYLERKLASPESLYGSNPAMKKGAEDVQRLAVTRFKKVVDKLRQVKGLENLTPNMIRRIFNEEMSKIPMVVGIENRYKQQLEDLAVESALDDTGTPEGRFQIEARLNRLPIDVSNFRYEPEEPEEDEGEEKEPKTEIPSFDIEDLTPEEEFELEKHKRNIVNAMVQGYAKKAHYLFQKPEVRRKLDAIDQRLYPAYLGIMAVNDLLYFTEEQMIEMMSATGNGVAGKVQLDDADNAGGGEEGGGEGEEMPDTKIIADGLIFPILSHELVKGIKSANARSSHSKNPLIRKKVQMAVDTLANEPMQLRIGPEIIERFRNLLPDQLFDESNKDLINWFEIELYQVPAREFLSEIIANVISEDKTKNAIATKKFEELVKKASELKSEYDNYKKEKGDDEDDDDGLDDFLGNLGITRPK